jgi:two-component system, response regulator PdtaR
MPTRVPDSILVVEDEVLIRLMIADDLMQAGFQVIQAGTGDDALKVLRSSVKVDLLLTDIHMPGGLDGLQLAAEVRANWPAVKIVILSSQRPVGLVPTLADGFVGKPYRDQDLFNCVNQLLGRANDQP